MKNYTLLCVLIAGLSIQYNAPIFAQQFPAPIPASAPAELLNNGDFFEGDTNWRVGGATTAAVVDAPDGSYWKLQTAVSPGDETFVGLAMQTLNVPLKKGERLRLSVRARSPQSLKMGFMVEGSGAPYQKVIGNPTGDVAQLSPQWKTFKIEGMPDQDYAAEGARVTFHLGYGNGTIEIGEVHLLAFDRAAVPRATAPTPARELLNNGNFAANSQGWASGGSITGDIKVEPTGGPNGGAFLRLTPQTAPNPEQPWSVQLGQPLDSVIPQGSAVYLRVYLRAPEGQGRASLVWEEASAPNTKRIYETPQLSAKWQEFRLVGYAPKTYAPGETQLKIFTGFGAAPIDIANARVEALGRVARTKLDVTPVTIDYKANYHPDESWKPAALARIEKYRKAPLNVRVVDAAGKPVAGANVKIEMTHQAFRWGVAAKASRFVVDSPDNQKFRDLTARWFNEVTFENDMKWNQEPPDLEKLREVDKALGWLKAHDIQVRGHNMVWGDREHMPANVWNLDTAALRRSVMERVDWSGKRYRGDVYAWDVVNEATDKVALWDRIGWESFAEAYRRARVADPNALLAYNDFNITNGAGDAGHRAKVFARIKYLIDSGAPLDIIGDQAHMDWPLTPIKRYLENLNEVASLGKPIEITEFDLGVPDDEVHGAYVRDFLIASFSQPAVESVIQWGIWESDHWRAGEGGALVRRDWSLRPAAVAYEDLVKKQWWTNESGVSAANGNVEKRAFLGDYRITVTKNGRSITTQTKLAQPGATVEVKLP